MSERESHLKVSVVIPVYNERATIEQLLQQVQNCQIKKEIIIVDDYSLDGTREFLQLLDRNTRHTPAVMTLPHTGYQLRTDNIRVFFQDKNYGKGAALRRGFREARGEIILIQDADLEYDPQDYPKLLEPFERGMADVVYGSRFLGGPHRVLFFWHSVANTILTMVSNMLTDLNLSDVWTCYKAFRREVLQHIELREDRFGFEPEVTAKVARGGWRIYEVPISYWGRTYAEGKKIGWKDAFRGLWCTLRYNILVPRVQEGAMPIASKEKEEPQAPTENIFPATQTPSQTAPRV
jgi:glycosyltransferase involved in cell wall biosynthesis